MTQKQIAKHLANFFKDEPEKITIWWLTENPLIGCTTPAWFYSRRPERFGKWFKGMMEGAVNKELEKKRDELADLLRK